MKIITLLFVLLFSFTSLKLLANDLDKGIEAYDKKDYKTAFVLLEPLAKQGNVRAQYNLGNAYYYGRGVTQDDKQAVYWYEKAAKQGNARAKNNLANFKFKVNCAKTAQTKLFETSIKCANRDQMMTVIKKGGAGIKREDKKQWGDTYYTGNVLKGSSELYVTYTVDDKFALAQYTFPSHMDTMQVRKVKNLLANKYGKPDYVSGRINLGKVTYKWYQKDGIELKVSRDWPDTTTYLTYTYPKHNKLRLAEMERQKQAKEKEESMTQSNAF